MQFNPMQFQPMQQMQGGYEAQFVEIDGKASIANLVMPPNQRRVYFDRAADRFYSVATDALGAKTVAEYEFKEVQEPPAPSYVTVTDFEEWRNGIEQLIQQIAESAANQQRGIGAGASIYPGVQAAGTPATGNLPRKPEHAAG